MRTIAVPVGCSLLLTMALAALWAQPDAPAGGDTLGYWRFEPDALLADSSPAGRDLLPVGPGLSTGEAVAPQQVPETAQPNAGAAVFPGAGAARVASDGSGPLAFRPGQDFTFECWLRTAKSIGVSVLLSKVREDPDAAGQRSHGFDFLTIPGRGSGPGAPLHFRIYTRRDGLDYLIAVDDALRPETTYHIALCRSGTLYQVYIDGRLRGQARSEATIESDGDLFIGTLGLGDRPFGGHYQPAGVRIDEARLTGRALLPDGFLLFPGAGRTALRLDLGATQEASEAGWQAAGSETVRAEPAGATGRVSASGGVVPQAGSDAPGAMLSTALTGMQACKVDAVPGVYRVRLHFCEVDPAVRGAGQRVFDMAINGREVLSRFDIAAEAGGTGRGLVREFGDFECPDGRLYMEFLPRTPPGAILNGLELVAADRKLAHIAETVESGVASGWEFTLAPFDRLIPDPIVLTHELLREPNDGVKFPYVPAQKFAPYPERLNPSTRRQVTGIAQLAADTQEPIGDGVRFLPGKGGSYEIHHRRAGVRCELGPRFRLRMERFSSLATVELAVRVGGQLRNLDSFAEKSLEVRPGRVRYNLKDEKLGLSAVVEAVAPASVPAYGMIVQVQLRDESGEARELELLTAAGAGQSADWSMPAGAVADPSAIILDVPQPMEVDDARYRNPRPLYLHDTAYTVAVGLDGNAAAWGSRVVGRRLSLPANGEARAQVTAFIDSPGFDEELARGRIRGYFDRNPNLPEAVRERMTEDALDTYARIVVSGDASFAKVRDDGGAAFAECCRAWEAGVYRDQPVRFELPDGKLQALANLAAGDLFPGIVQPPGMVHDAKYGDVWNYIFCYRHVHAASDIGLEPLALGYLRLLSANQQANGRVASIRQNFESMGHGTQFDESYIDAVHHYYKWTGDLEAVRELWPTLERAMGYLDSALDPDGDGLYKDTIHQWKSDFDSRGPSSSFQTALVWRACRDLAEIAGKLGDADGQARYTAKAEAIRQAALGQLWSADGAMFGAKGPLGMLRLHPQSLEVEIPVWTGLMDEFQAVALTDWYLHSVGFGDEQGGLWMYDNDWWPVVWSQHMGSPGDYMMVGWALMLAGDHDAGCRTLETVAGGSFREGSPGFNYTFDDQGRHGGNDPATAQGAFFRALVEGLFGVRPAIDEGRVTISPRMPSDWDRARFTRPGLDVQWQRDRDAQILKVVTAPGVAPTVEFAVRGAVADVLVDGRPARWEARPGMRWGIISVTLPAGGGEALVRTATATARVDAPERASVGEQVRLSVSGVDEYRVEDRLGFFDPVSANPREPGDVALRLAKPGCGRAVVFLRCRSGNVEWIEPVALSTLPETARETQPRTVLDSLPDGARLVPVDLSGACNDDIQTCFSHRWQWDANDGPGGEIRYWTMPLFTLSRPIPRKVRVGDMPFLLGPMGPGEAESVPDLLMIANTPPRELPTGVRLDLGGRRLHKLCLLSLNMILPQKCYVPAVEATVRYADGTARTTQLIPPLNFDCFFQDFGINTAALPLPAQGGYGMGSWVGYGGVDLKQHHLTMTDIACDPSRQAVSLELRSIATETFMGLAGLTLVEAGQ